MKSNKLKAFFLGAILLLPVLIFLFLKSFGSNQFTVPIYYEAGVGDTLAIDCGRNNTVPYEVFTKPASQKKLKVYHFEKNESDQLSDRLEQLERVQDVFAEDHTVLLFTFLNHPEVSDRSINKYADRVNIDPSFWSIRPVDYATWDAFKNCELVMNEQDDRVVLVDANERIRGYYDINDREETDRLILELKILLSLEE